MTTGQSGWQWANPQPQGNTLTDIEFAGGRGYAAGEFGTLLTTQNGLDWDGISTGLTSELYALRAVDADTVIVGAGCVMRRSDDGGQTFQRVPFVAREQGCPAELAAFHYPTAQSGYVVLTDGTVSKSDPGGGFSGRRAVPGTKAAGDGQAMPGDVYFVSESTGFVTVGGDIYRTTDGAQSWVREHTGTAALRSVYFADATTGYAAGASDTILKSVDGGASWTPVPVPAAARGGNLTRVRCVNPAVCLFSTESGDKVLRTRDGGTTVQAHDPSARPIYAFAFASPTSAVGVGQFGATTFSGDAGTLTATPGFTGVGDRLGAGEDLILARVRATDGQVVHAPGNRGRLGRSTDGGRTWATVIVPTSQDLVDVSFPDANTGFSADSAGALRYTANGGGSWTPIDIGSQASVRAVHAANQNVVMLFTNRGVRRSTAASDTSGGGTTFEGVGSSKLRRSSLRDFDRAGGQTLFAFGSSSLWRSTNNGSTWAAIRKPTKKARFRAVDFTSANQGYALLTNGRLYVTRTRGRKWSELRGLGDNSGVDVTFGDARNGYVTIPSWGGLSAGGWVLRTADGGKTWRPQLLGPSRIPFGGLEAPGATSAFALGRSGEGRNADLFRTESGGDEGDASTISLRRSKSRLGRRGGRVQLTVSLNPSVSGARVALFARTGSGRWSLVRGGLTTAGKLTVTRRVRRTTQFVAQWYGDADRAGDGSPVGTVTVSKKKKRK